MAGLLDEVPADLLFNFLAGEARARELLPRVASKMMLSYARRFAPDLPPDLQHEVVAEAGLLLVRKTPSDFDPARGGPSTFLRLLVRNAAQIVRAANAAPASRDQRRQHGEDGASVAFRLDELADQVDDDAHAVESQCAARALLQAAPRRVARALWRVHVEGGTLEEVAASEGVSRFVLGKEIAEYTTAVRAAA